MIALRQAGVEDAPVLERFLAGYAETSMFLRGNLAAHGIANKTHRHGTTYWLHEQRGIAGVVACSNGGYLMCQAPLADASFWQSARAVLEGRRISGATGEPGQVNALLAALGLGSSAFSVKETEPLYKLALGDLAKPDHKDLQLRRPEALDIPLLAEWFEGYACDTGITPTDGATGEIAAEVFAESPAARVLERCGVRVAMTSLNARVAETVQVGGVYVPPIYRGQGLGGAVVALQLFELLEEGVKVAILFAANADAARAYERIGFQHIGSYEIALLKKPLEIKDAPHVFPT